MICKNCGAEVADGAKFCKHCGTPQNAAAAQPEKKEENVNAQETGKEPEKQAVKEQPKQSAPVANNVPAGGNKAAKTDKPKKSAAKVIVPIVIAVVLVAVIAVAGVLVIKMMPKKVNLNEYLSVEFEGYDTLGSAKIKYDEELLEVLGKQLGLSNRDISKLEDLEDVDAFLAGDEKDYSRDVRKLYSCMKTLDIELDQDQDLSNGDTITLKVGFDNDEAKAYKVKFLGEDATYTVKDLKKLDIIDAFADYTLTFSGIAPEGTAKGEYTGPTKLDDGYTYIDYYYFNIDKSYSLRNGDEVTVTINIYDENTLLEHGAKLKELSKTFTVEGLDEYVTSYDGLTAEYIDYAKSEANDVIAAYMAQNSSSYNLDSLEYAGYIFDSPKPDADYWSYYNDLYVIYKGSVSYESNGVATSVTVYFPVQFYNILSTADGLNGKKNDTILGYSALPGSWSSVRGYINPILAYTDMVNSKIDKYQVESGDGFEVFSEYVPVATFDDISSESIQDLETRAIDAVNQYVISSYNKECEVSDLAVCGYYLLVAKEQTGDFRNHNRIYVVCQGTVTNTKKRFATTTVYYPVEFDGIVNLPNGEFLFVENKGIQGSSTFEGSYYTTKGYINGEDMFDALATQNRVNYSYEVSEGLKEFGE